MTKKTVEKSLMLMLIWVIIGLAAALALSLAGGAAILKTADPLKAIVPVAIGCVGLGAFCAALGASAKGGVGAGFGAGGVYLLVLLAASLWGEGGTSPLLPFAATLAGTAAGALLGMKRKPSAHKRIKKLIKTR